MSRKHWAYRMGQATAWLVIWLAVGVVFWMVFSFAAGRIYLTLTN